MRLIDVVFTYWCPFCRRVSVADRSKDGTITCPHCGAPAEASADEGHETFETLTDMLVELYEGLRR